MEMGWGRAGARPLGAEGMAPGGPVLRGGPGIFKRPPTRWRSASLLEIPRPGGRSRPPGVAGRAWMCCERKRVCTFRS